MPLTNQVATPRAKASLFNHILNHLSLAKQAYLEQFGLLGGNFNSDVFDPPTATSHQMKSPLGPHRGATTIISVDIFILADCESASAGNRGGLQFWSFHARGWNKMEDPPVIKGGNWKSPN